MTTAAMTSSGAGRIIWMAMEILVCMLVISAVARVIMEGSPSAELPDA